MEELRRQCESEETVRRQAIINAEHQRALQLRLVENMQKWEQAVRLRRFIDPAATGIGGQRGGGRHVKALVEWAREHVDVLDSLGKHATTSLDRAKPRAPLYSSKKSAHMRRPQAISRAPRLVRIIAGVPSQTDC